MNTVNGNIQADRALVEKVLRGDTNAFAEIVKGTERLVYQIVTKMVTINGDRPDIAQDIYLKAFSRLATFKFEARLSTWIAQIAYNTCLNYLEKKKLVLVEDIVEGDLNDTKGSAYTSASRNNDTELAELLLFDKDLKQVLELEIEKLPPVYKTLITLYHIQEFNYDEIGQITSLPQGTVKNYLFRARKVLKQNISKNYKREDL